MNAIFEMNDGTMEFVEFVHTNSPYVDFKNETVCVPYDGTENINKLAELVTQAFYSCFYKQFEKLWSCSTVNARRYAGIEYGISPDMPYKEIEYVTGRDYDVLWHIYCEL